jgi:3-oxoacyl-[acyl-carrier protein] reductase
MLDFTGRSVFVTGGSRGVGRATALLFARTGADVALSYHTRRDAAEGVAAEIRALGRRAVVVGGDHADVDAVGGMYAAIIEGLGGLDVFVANAGIWPERDVPLAEMPASRWAETLRANLDGVYLTTRAALQVLRPGGSVVLVSSTAGQRGEAYHADYAVTKGGLLALTKSLAIECAPDITVNCCAPGWIDTDMCAGVLTPEYRARVESSIPLGRIATADDVAWPIVFLASPLARHITGEILNVNGGSVLCG